jgi:hypothetical protein
LAPEYEQVCPSGHVWPKFNGRGEETEALANAEALSAKLHNPAKTLKTRI